MWTVSQGFMGPMAGSPEFQALDPATGGTFRSRRDTEGGEAAVPSPTPSSSLGIGCSSKESPLLCPLGPPGSSSCPPWPHHLCTSHMSSEAQQSLTWGSDLKFLRPLDLKSSLSP